MNIRFKQFCAALTAAGALALTGLGAVAQPSAPNDASSRPPRAVASARVGSIVAIEPIRKRPSGSGAGAVAGGVVGGLVGNKVLGGTAATAIGAVGGAVAGNNLERNYRKQIVGYHVQVRLDNGTAQTFDQTQLGGLRVGERVRVRNGRIQRL